MVDWIVSQGLRRSALSRRSSGPLFLVPKTRAPRAKRNDYRATSNE